MKRLLLFLLCVKYAYTHSYEAYVVNTYLGRVIVY